MTNFISAFTGDEVDEAVRLRLQSPIHAKSRPVILVDGEDQDSVVLLPQQLLAGNTVYQMRMSLHIERTGTDPVYQELLPPVLLCNAQNIQGALDGATNLDAKFLVQTVTDPSESPPGPTGTTVEALEFLSPPVFPFTRGITFPSALVDDATEVIVQYSGTIYTTAAVASIEIAAAGVLGSDVFRYKVRDAVFEFNVASQVV